MKIKAIAPWFGGKRTMAPDIVEQLGPHTQYFEPFCGSMDVYRQVPDEASAQPGGRTWWERSSRSADREWSGTMKIPSFQDHVREQALGQ